MFASINELGGENLALAHSITTHKWLVNNHLTIGPRCG